MAMENFFMKAGERFEPGEVANVVIPATIGLRKPNSAMRRFPLFALAALVALLTACTSTPEARIAKSQALFDGFAPAVQQKIRAGQVDLGFTPDMVRLALGEPSRVFTRQTEGGATELWVYNDNGPRFSIGVGVGSFGRHSASSLGVSTSTGGYDPDEKMRVEFRDGRVTAVEYLRR
jgi:hypothetical protein